MGQGLMVFIWMLGDKYDRKIKHVFYLGYLSHLGNLLSFVVREQLYISTPSSNQYGKVSCLIKLDVFVLESILFSVSLYK